jgi:hypothetical protein
MNIKYEVKWLKQIDLHQLYALKKKMEVDNCFTCKLSLRGVKLDNGLTTNHLTSYLIPINNSFRN